MYAGSIIFSGGQSVCDCVLSVLAFNTAEVLTRNSCRDVKLWHVGTGHRSDVYHLNIF